METMPPRPVAVGAWPADWIYRLRMSPWYKAFFQAIKLWILPHLSAALMLIGALLLVSRTLFAIGTAAGAVCNSTSVAGSEFDTRSLCWATGVHVDAGEKYRITMTVTEPWQDGAIATDLQGFALGELRGLPYVAMLAATPLRRSIAALGSSRLRASARSAPSKQRLSRSIMLAVIRSSANSPRCSRRARTASFICSSTMR